jgi:hypothetical protein
LGYPRGRITTTVPGTPAPIAGQTIDGAFDQCDADTLSIRALQSALQPLGVPSALPSSPPPYALAAGHTTRTRGGLIQLGTIGVPGSDWYPMNFPIGSDPTKLQFTRNADGSVTLGGDGGGYGAGIAMGYYTGTPGVWKGLALRGGYTIELLFKTNIVLRAPTLPFPCFFGLDPNFLTENPYAYPAISPAYPMRAEIDWAQVVPTTDPSWQKYLAGLGGLLWLGRDFIGAGVGPPTANVSITGTGGQIAISGAGYPMRAGDFFWVSGTLTGSGSITGYDPANIQTPYQIATTNGSTTATLRDASTNPITTTAGSVTGLTFGVNLAEPINQLIQMGPPDVFPFNAFPYTNYNLLSCVVPLSSTVANATALVYLNGVLMDYPISGVGTRPTWGPWNPVSRPLPPTRGQSGAFSLAEYLGVIPLLGGSPDLQITVGGYNIWQASQSLNIVQ